MWPKGGYLHHLDDRDTRDSRRGRLSSQLGEGQVLEELERGVVPVTDSHAARNPLEPLAHQVDYIVQRLHYEYVQEFTYLLASGGLLWIQLSEFEAGEQELDRRRRVAVGRAPDHAELHLVQELADLLAYMVLCAVQ